MADTARLYSSINETLSRRRRSSSPRRAADSLAASDPSADAPRGAAAALEDALRAAGIRGSIRDQAKAVSRRASRGAHHYREHGAAERVSHGRHHHHHDTGTMRVATVGGVQRKDRDSSARPVAPFSIFICESATPPGLVCIRVVLTPGCPLWVQQGTRASAA